MFCKLTNFPLPSSSILINQFSDHNPYFLVMNTDKNNTVPPKKVRICNFMQAAVNDFLTEIAESNISE